MIIGEGDGSALITLHERVLTVQRILDLPVGYSASLTWDRCLEMARQDLAVT